MYSHQSMVRVRYGETDRMGYLYYGNYAPFYEVGRVEALRALGIDYRTLEDEHGIFMPVMSMQVRYLRPAFYDEQLKLETSILRMPERIIEFETKIYNEKNEFVNQGLITLCFVQSQDKKRIDVPEIIKEKLKPYFE